MPRWGLLCKRVSIEMPLKDKRWRNRSQLWELLDLNAASTPVKREREEMIGREHLPTIYWHFCDLILQMFFFPILFLLDTIIYVSNSLMLYSRFLSVCFFFFFFFQNFISFSFTLYDFLLAYLLFYLLSYHCHAVLKFSKLLKIILKFALLISRIWFWFWLILSFPFLFWYFLSFPLLWIYFV